MGVFDNLKKNLQKKDDNAIQKEQAEANRNSGERLLKELEKARTSLPGLENEVACRFYGNVIQLFKSAVEKCETIGTFDVTEMDRKLLEMISLFGEAIKQGDLDTAKRGYRWINLVFQEYRRELNKEEEPRKEEILKVRLEKMDEFRTLIKTSEALFIDKQNLEKVNKDYNKAKSEYEELFNKTLEIVEEHPEWHEKVRNYVEGDSISGEERELRIAELELDSIKARKDSLNQAILTYSRQVLSHKTSVESQEIKLSVKTEHLTLRENEIIKNADKKYTQNLANIMQESKILEDMERERNIAIDKIVEGSDFGKKGMESAISLEREIQRRKLEEQRKAENKIKRENETKQNNDTIMLN